MKYRIYVRITFLWTIVCERLSWETSLLNHFARIRMRQAGVSLKSGCESFNKSRIFKGYHYITRLLFQNKFRKSNDLLISFIKIKIISSVLFIATSRRYNFIKNNKENKSQSKSLWTAISIQYDAKLFKTKLKTYR